MTKLHIPPEAITTLQNTDFFSFKRQFTEHLIDYFGSLMEDLKSASIIRDFPFPEGMDTTVGKITKGENYRGLPYVIADFPRLFTPESVMAYRVMFWWGHYFSCTWHWSGQALKQFYPMIQQKWPLKFSADVRIAFTGDEWQHALEEPVYQPISEVNLPQVAPDFLKIAILIPFERHSAVTELAKKYAVEVLMQLQD